MKDATERTPRQDTRGGGSAATEKCRERKLLEMRRELIDSNPSMNDESVR